MSNKLELTITQAGLSALMNARNNKTPIRINKVSISEKACTVDDTLTEMPDVAYYIEGSDVAQTTPVDEIIKVTALDKSEHEYKLFSFGCWLDDANNTLYGAYSQQMGDPEPILTKTSSSVMELVIDTKLVSGDTHDIPLASEETAGVVRLASLAEVSAGTDTSKAITPVGLAKALPEQDETGAWQISITGTAAFAEALNSNNSYAVKNIRADIFTGDLSGVANGAKQAKVACELNSDNNYTVKNQISFKDGGRISSAVPNCGMVYQPSINGQFSHVWQDANGRELMTLDSNGVLRANLIPLSKSVDNVPSSDGGVSYRNVSLHTANGVELHYDDPTAQRHVDSVTFHNDPLKVEADWLWGGLCFIPGQCYRVAPADLNVNSAKKAEGLTGAALQGRALGSYELVRRARGTAFGAHFTTLDDLPGTWEPRGMCQLTSDDIILYQRIA